MSCALSKLKKVGLALGAGDYGTPAANTAAFTRGLVVSGFTVDPVQTVEGVPEVRGTLGITRVTKGPIAYTPTISFPLDMGAAAGACIGDFLAGVYGTETGELVSGPAYKHTFTLLESCSVPWFNLVSDMWAAATGKQITGFVPGSVKMTVNAKEASIPVEVTGIAQTEIDGYGTTSLSYSTANVVSGSMATTVELAGSAVTSLESIDITWAREQEPINYLSSTARYVGEVASGKTFSIMINATGLQFANETERDKFLATTSSSFQLMLTEGTNIMNIYLPQIHYQTFAGPTLAGAGDLLRVNFSAIATGTASAHYVELTNQYSKSYTDGSTIS